MSSQRWKADVTALSNALNVDVEREIARISEFIRETVIQKYKRRGAVIGLSGGIDSAVVAGLLVQALGREKVRAILLPEKESSRASTEFGLTQAKKLVIQSEVVDITDRLAALKLYDERDAVIKNIFPQFDSSFRFHVTLPPDFLERDEISYYSMTIEDKNGDRETKRLPVRAWLRISSCQNMKQRVRMLELYHHAEEAHYAVAGTTNKTELCQGFFVKYGDGGVDLEPISHLYKTQVYALAERLGVIDEIIRRPPSPDTYSLPVTDKEFYFCMEYALLDLLLYAYDHQTPNDDIRTETGLDLKEIGRAFKIFKAREQATWHLRQLPPSL